jgi:hypothetical protein
MVATLEYRKVCVRPHTSFKTAELIVNIGWTVVTYPPYSQDLAPTVFHLLGRMKGGLRGKHFPYYDSAVQAAKQWATSAGPDFVHRWRRCIANGGDYAEK